MPQSAAIAALRRLLTGLCNTYAIHCRAAEDFLGYLVAYGNRTPTWEALRDITAALGYGHPKTDQLIDLTEMAVAA